MSNFPTETHHELPVESSLRFAVVSTNAWLLCVSMQILSVSGWEFMSLCSLVWILLPF